MKEYKEEIGGKQRRKKGEAKAKIERIIIRRPRNLCLEEKIEKKKSFCEG